MASQSAAGSVSVRSGRVFFRDVKPYAVVDGLDRLQGPVDGVIELSRSVLWVPGDGRVDLDRPGELRMTYRAVLNKGTVSDLERVLNPGRPTDDPLPTTAPTFGMGVSRPRVVSGAHAGLAPRMHACSVRSQHDTAFGRPGALDPR